MTTNICPNLYATKNGAGPARVALSVAATAADTYNVLTWATGSLTFTANPAAATTVVIDGTTWTFVATLTSGNQLLLGANLSQTLANSAVILNQSADTNTKLMSYRANQWQLLITAKAAGTAGNAYTLTAGTSGATASGATLLGGSTLVSAVVDSQGPFRKACAALRAAGPYDNDAFVDFYMPLFGGGVSLATHRIDHGMQAATSYYSADSEA